MSLLNGLGLGGIMGHGPTQNISIGTPHAQQAAQPLTQSHLAAQAAAQFNAAYQSMYSQAQIQGLGLSRMQQVTAAEWMIAGRVLTFDEFVDELFPDDCAERTYIILKFKGTENDTST